MVLDSLQNYVNLVSGASKASRAKAAAAARGLLSQAGLEEAATDAQERISRLADDIVNASRANRELLETLVGAEVEKAAARLGFARTEQLEDLQAQITELRVQVEGLTVPPTVPVPTPPAPASKAPAGKAPAKKTPAKKAPAKKTPAKAPATSAAATTSSTPAGDASPARKQTTKKSPATKAAAKKSPAAKAAARTAPGVAAAKRTSPAERAAKRTVASPSPRQSEGDLS